MKLFQEQDWSQSDLCLAPSNRISKIMDLEKVLQSSWMIQRDVVVRMNELAQGLAQNKHNGGSYLFNSHPSGFLSHARQVQKKCLVLAI